MLFVPGWGLLHRLLNIWVIYNFPQDVLIPFLNLTVIKIEESQFIGTSFNHSVNALPLPDQVWGQHKRTSVFRMHLVEESVGESPFLTIPDPSSLGIFVTQPNVAINNCLFRFNIIHDQRSFINDHLFSLIAVRNSIYESNIGNLCAECQEGYAYRNTYTKTCTKCSDNSHFYVISIILVLIGLAYFVIVIKSALGTENVNKKKNRVKKPKKSIKQLKDNNKLCTMDSNINAM